MTAPGRYAAADGSFARSTGNAAARGGALIAVAVVIGFLLLWKGGVGGDSSAAPVTSTGSDAGTDNDDSGDDGTGAAADDGSTDDSGFETGDDAAGDDAAGTDTTTPTSEAPATPTTHPVNEVKVVVINGVGEAGLAGARMQILTTAGYIGAAENAATRPVEASAIYYLTGYDQDAAAVAQELGADPAAVLRPAPADPTALVEDATGVEDFHIWVVLGTDAVLHTSS